MAATSMAPTPLFGGMPRRALLDRLSIRSDDKIAKHLLDDETTVEELEEEYIHQVAVVNSALNLNAHSDDNGHNGRQETLVKRRNGDLRKAAIHEASIIFALHVLKELEIEADAKGGSIDWSVEAVRKAFRLTRPIYSAHPFDGNWRAHLDKAWFEQDCWAGRYSDFPGVGERYAKSEALQKIFTDAADAKVTDGDKYLLGKAKEVKKSTGAASSGERATSSSVEPQDSSTTLRTANTDKSAPGEDATAAVQSYRRNGARARAPVRFPGLAPTASTETTSAPKSRKRKRDESDEGATADDTVDSLSNGVEPKEGSGKTLVVKLELKCMLKDGKVVLASNGARSKGSQSSAIKPKSEHTSEGEAKEMAEDGGKKDGVGSEKDMGEEAEAMEE